MKILINIKWPIPKCHELVMENVYACMCTL
jgi:hypothetical protein